MFPKFRSVHQRRPSFESPELQTKETLFESQNSATPNELDSEHDENYDYPSSPINLVHTTQGNSSDLSSQIRTTKPPLPSKITSPAESVRQFYKNIKTIVDEYWSSQPLQDLEDANAEINLLCERVLSGEDLPLRESIKIIKILHYRLAVMRTAEFYVHELGLLQNLDGEFRTHSESDFWKGRRWQDFSFAILQIDHMQVFGDCTYSKPGIYLAVMMIEAGYSNMDVALASRWLKETYREISCADEQSQAETAMGDELVKLVKAGAWKGLWAMSVRATNSGKRKFSDAFASGDD